MALQDTLYYNQKKSCISFDLYWRFNEEDEFVLVEERNLMLGTDVFDLQLKFQNYRIRLLKCQLKEVHLKEAQRPVAPPEKRGEEKSRKKSLIEATESQREEVNGVRVRGPDGRFTKGNSFAGAESQRKLPTPVQGPQNPRYLTMKPLSQEEQLKIRKQQEERERQRKIDKAIEGENVVNFERRPQRPALPSSPSNLNSQGWHGFRQRLPNPNSPPRQSLFPPVPTPPQITINQRQYPTFSNTREDNYRPSQSSQQQLLQNVLAPVADPGLQTQNSDPSPPQTQAGPQHKLSMEDTVFCPICYSESMNDRVTIDCCGHQFCTPCIEEWTKQTNLCPLCRVKFNSITVFKDDILMGKRKVADKQFVYEEQETSEDRIIQNADDECYVCQRGDRENDLLICDSCLSKVCHIFCTSPPMRHIPEGDWFCDYCVRDKELVPVNPTARIFERRRLRRMVDQRVRN